MVKVGNLIDHVIKNGRIDIKERGSRSKKGNFSKKKKGETQALYNIINLTNPEDTPHTKTTQIINHITQL